MAEMRKSTIRKSIVRKLNTAKYETLDIIVDHSHEVEWPDKDIETLMKKSAGVTKLVIKDYQATEAQVLGDLNLSGSSAFPGEGAPRAKLTAAADGGFDRV